MNQQIAETADRVVMAKVGLLELKLGMEYCSEGEELMRTLPCSYSLRF